MSCQATGKEIAKRLPTFRISDKLVAQASGFAAHPSGLTRSRPYARIAPCWIIHWLGYELVANAKGWKRLAISFPVA